MISFRDLTATQRTLLAVGGAAVVAALVILLAASDLDLTAIRTLRTVHMGGDGTIVETQYNPLGVFGIGLSGFALLAILGLVFTGFLKRLWHTVEARYRSVSVVGVVLGGFALLAFLGQVFTGFLKLLSKTVGGLSSEAVTAAGRKLEQELSKVLDYIRGHISTNESYARSLAN